MPPTDSLSRDELAAWRADCERFGRELPQPRGFRDAPRDEDGRLIDPARGPKIAIYPDNTFPTVEMPPIFGTVCGSHQQGWPSRQLTPDEAEDEAVELCFLRGCSPFQAWERLRTPVHDPGQKIADEIKARYAAKVVTNGRQLSARQQQTEEAALTLWLDSRIGRAAQARAASFDPWEEWDKLQELTREDYRKQARKQLKETADSGERN